MWRKILTILFLPAAIFIFMIGWSLQWIGQARNKNRVKTPLSEPICTEEDIAHELLEVQVIEDLMERVLKTE